MTSFYRTSPLYSVGLRPVSHQAMCTGYNSHFSFSFFGLTARALLAYLLYHLPGLDLPESNNTASICWPSIFLITTLFSLSSSHNCSVYVLMSLDVSWYCFGPSPNKLSWKLFFRVGVTGHHTAPRPRTSHQRHMSLLRKPAGCSRHS